jgi:hypothetical protein
MNDRNDLPQWTQQARHLLDESAQVLDGATASRLNRARQAALAQRRTGIRAPRWYWSAGLATCALLLAVGVWQGRGTPSTTTAPIPIAASTDAGTVHADDLDLLASGDNLEMMQDLDFYAWLDAQDTGSNG